MQSGVTKMSPEASFASTTVPYFQLASSGGGFPPGNVNIQGNLGVTGTAAIDGTLTVGDATVIDGALTVGDATSLINLAGPGNFIGAGPANVVIASDATITLSPGPGLSVTTNGDSNASGIVRARFGSPAEVQIAAAGVAQITSGSNNVTVPFGGMTVGGKILATITGNFNNAGAISVVPSINEFYIFSQNLVGANTNIFWMVIGLA